MGYLWLRSWPGVFFILIMFISGSHEASALDTGKPWRCQFQVTVVGNAFEFYRTGFDTWDALGEISCIHSTTRQTETTEWYFVFRSWSRSTGIDSRNTFVMESQPFYVVAPALGAGTYFYQSISFAGTVHNGGPFSVMNLVNQAVRMQVSIKNPSVPADLSLSLSSGTLIIGPPPSEMNSFR